MFGVWGLGLRFSCFAFLYVLGGGVLAFGQGSLRFRGIESCVEAVSTSARRGGSMSKFFEAFSVGEVS